MNWKTMPEGREKYAAYLASREWAVKKEAVRNRSNGVCERCKKNPHEQTHHLTYIRKYNEYLDDLLGLCRPCHEFLSGKSNEDPAEGAWKPKIYFAGKISCNDWRKEMADVEDKRIGEVFECGDFFYCGPWFIDCDHCCFHRVGSHGVGAVDSSEATLDLNFGQHPHEFGCGSTTPRAMAYAICLDGIRRADCVFAWIDAPDCYGTIYEIAFAHSIDKPVFLHFSSKQLYDDMWFIRESYKQEGSYISANAVEGFHFSLPKMLKLEPQIPAIPF